MQKISEGLLLSTKKKKILIKKIFLGIKNSER